MAILLVLSGDFVHADWFIMCRLMVETFVVGDQLSLLGYYISKRFSILDTGKGDVSCKFLGHVYSCPFTCMTKEE